MTDAIFHLSKSRYIKAVHCPKLLWLFINRREEYDASAENAAILDEGNRVGDLAMGYLGEFTEVPYNEDYSQMIEDTERLMAEGVENIAEASFSFDGCFCSVDILRNKGDRHVEIYEVKMSTGVHEIYHHDVSYQNYVLTKLGFIVDGVFLVHVNKHYVRHGDIELDKLFVAEDLTDIARSLFADVENRIAEIREFMKPDDEPDIDISEICGKKDDCPYWKYCSKDLPKPNVFDVGGMHTKTKVKYYRSGVLSFEDLRPYMDKLNDKMARQVEFEINDAEPYIDVENIREFMKTLTYPIYFFDFETFDPAVPRYDDSSPFEQIPFQYSLHYIEKEGGDLKSKAFLAYPGKDPRRDLSEQMCRDIPKDACVVAYNMGFEKTQIKAMAKLFPDLADHLMNIHDNMKDLMVPFQKGYYYCRAMEGRYTIKYVLPALFPDDPELDYHNLEGVHNGGEASAAFPAMENMTPEEVEKLRGYLLKYCGLDTYALVKVFELLRQI